MAIRTLKMEESKARELYRTAGTEFKALLEESFGKDFFSEKITDRIKTFENVMTEALRWFNEMSGSKSIVKISKIQKIIYDILLNHVRGNRVTADDRVKLIAFVLNEGWEEDFTNSNQYKYYPYFQKNKAGGWAVGYGVCDCGHARLGAGLYYKDSETALYAGKQFITEYSDYLP